MRVSVNWVKQYTSIPANVDELVGKIGLQLGAVDEVIDAGAKYKGAVIAKVVSADKHPNADKLKLCFIDDGGADKNVERDPRGHIQVVCGAPNVAKDQLVVWLPPGTTVPNTYGKDPFVLEARELRDKVSNGMIASAKELDIGDDHSGIVVIDEDIKPGTPLAEAFDLDDYTIDIENKMFTHRPDCFGMLGIAREIAGIQNKPFKSPDWYREDTKLSGDGRKNVLKLDVQNEVPELVTRFCAVALKDVKVGPSPVFIQTRLAAVGIRPVNNIVDLTNFIMYETAQPLHAYDYDKVKSSLLGVRLSKKGEKLTLLGGKTVSLDAGAVVITDGEKPIGLGGVMGGAGTEVDENTRNIILEVATFDQNLTRKTAMTYGLFTDAATRFTKNQSPLQNMAVLARAASDIRQIAGGRVASPVIDKKSPTVKAPKPVQLSAAFVNERLGTNLSAVQIGKLLENVEFGVDIRADQLKISVPFWRRDIEISEDIVEEVGRLYGYEHLPLELPPRDLTPAQPDAELVFKSRLRDVLIRAGGNEVLSYSFVHSSLIEKAGQDIKDAYHIRNAISPDLQYYRLSLTPSLLDKVHQNIKNGYGEFVLFELGRVHINDVLDKEKLPRELKRLTVVIAGKKTDQDTGADYYAAKTYADFLFGELGMGVDYAPLTDVKLPKEWQVAASVYEPKHTAAIYAGKQLLGLAGEPTAALRGSLKLPARVSALELDIEVLHGSAADTVTYAPLNRFPELEQDITLKLPARTTFAEADKFIAKQLGVSSVDHGYGFRANPLDIYQNPQDKAHKQLSWRITLWHPERTLTTQETNRLLDELAAAAKATLRAERI